MIWPNAQSSANSDAWLVANHDAISAMRPRVLGVNFVHGLSEAEARAQLETLAAVLRESSRPHGYADPDAPPFLEYEIGEIADLTEPRGKLRPQLGPLPARARRRRLRLRRAVPDAAAGGARGARRGQRGVAAGRSHRAQRAVGDGRGEMHLRRAFPADRPHAPRRQLRRAPRAVDRPLAADPVRQLRARRRLRDGEPRPLAGADGDVRGDPVLRALLPRVRDARPRPPLRAAVGVAVSQGQRARRLPDADVAEVPPGWRRHRLEDYVAAGGNVHFMPNGRFDYDLDGGGPVLSTIETWRQPGRWRDPGRPARSAPTATSRPTAWAAGSSTGARTCRASATPRSTTTAAR